VQFIADVNHENACGTGVFCNLDNRRCSNFGYFSHRFEVRCDVVAQRARPAPTLSPQHFLKWDSVFFDVLVYSGCSAFRFPSARSDQVNSLIIGDLTNSRGQHGQKSEEGEEGEERSEEDCEEDQEGFQEEEVTRLTKNAGGLMPARHTSHQDGLLLEANFKPEGSGRRKRVSARHQVKRPDRDFRQSSLFSEDGPAEEPSITLLAFFIRCGSVVRNFTGSASPRWNLTLTCSPTPSFRSPARA
jgi:hypothetical protein